jgi:hypothetical protein
MSPEDIASRFSSHPITSFVKSDTHLYIRQQCHQLANLFNERLPESREKEVSIDRLEEVMFWANAAVARHMD